MEETINQGEKKLEADSNYTDSFGFQWNRFQHTQIDREKQGLDQSKQRFLAVTEWDKEDLRGKKVLEVGSGAGRFTRAVLEVTEAEIYSVDFSDAVEVNRRNNGSSPLLQIKKASVYDLPYPSQSFDKVFCFGMLQHTPEPQRTVECLVEMVKPGGELIVDFYPQKGWYTRIHAKYLARPFTRRMNRKRLLNWIESNITSLIGLYKGLHRIKLGVLTRFIPLVDMYNVLPSGLSKEEEKEWAILDTFDMLSPRYDNPQKMRNVVKWIRNYGLEVTFSGKKKYSNSHMVYFVKAIRPGTDSLAG